MHVWGGVGGGGGVLGRFVDGRFVDRRLVKRTFGRMDVSSTIFP